MRCHLCCCLFVCFVLSFVLFVCARRVFLFVCSVGIVICVAWCFDVVLRVCICCVGCVVLLVDVCVRCAVL